jgi:hypothetical protein
MSFWAIFFGKDPAGIEMQCSKSVSNIESALRKSLRNGFFQYGLTGTVQDGTFYLSIRSFGSRGPSTRVLRGTLERKGGRTLIHGKMPVRTYSKFIASIVLFFIAAAISSGWANYKGGRGLKEFLPGVIFLCVFMTMTRLSSLFDAGDKARMIKFFYDLGAKDIKQN